LEMLAYPERNKVILADSSSAPKANSVAKRLVMYQAKGSRPEMNRIA